jgi:hypothetical protein
MAAVTRSRSAYSGKVSNERIELRTVPTVKLNIAGAESSIEDLHIDFPFGKRTCIKPNDGHDTFDDLPANNCCFRKAGTHYEDIDTQILSAERIFNIANEVTKGISHM